MTKNTRILMLNQDFPPYDSGGGNATAFMRYAKQLHDASFEVTVVAGRSPSKSFLEDRGFRICRVHFLDLPPRALWFQVENRKLILKLVSESDTVFSYFKSSSLLSKDIVSMGVPLVVKIGGSPISNTRNYLKLPIQFQSFAQTLYYLGELPLLNYLEKNDILYSTHLIFDSNYMLEEIERQYKIHVRDKSTVVHNSLSNGLAETYPPVEIKNHIVFVGRLYAVKGIMELINAFAILSKDEYCKSWKLIIIGDGPLKSRIHAAVRDLEIIDRVVLFGRIPHEKVLQEETNARIYVHPSHIEGNSNALAEAMALGLPVIVIRLPWAIEQTEGYNNKLFFMAGNSESLANRLREMISNLPTRKPLTGPLNNEGNIVDAIREVSNNVPARVMKTSHKIT